MDAMNSWGSRLAKSALFLKGSWSPDLLGPSHEGQSLRGEDSCHWSWSFLFFEKKAMESVCSKQETIQNPGVWEAYSHLVGLLNQINQTMPYTRTKLLTSFASFEPGFPSMIVWWHAQAGLRRVMEFNVFRRWYQFTFFECWSFVWFEIVWDGLSVCFSNIQNGCSCHFITVFNTDREAAASRSSFKFQGVFLVPSWWNDAFPCFSWKAMAEEFANRMKLGSTWLGPFETIYETIIGHLRSGQNQTSVSQCLAFNFLCGLFSYYKRLN